MFNKNILKLKEHYGEVYLKLMNSQHIRYKSVNSKNGMPNLIISDNVYLHSRYDPINEINKWIDGFEIKEEDTILIMGLGLGYYLKILTKRYPDKKLIIIEPDIAIFKEALNTNDLSEYIESEKIVFLIDMDPHSVESLIGHYIYTNRINKIFSAEMSIYRKINKEYLEEIYKGISKMVLSFKGNLITEIAFGQMWLENTVINLKTLMDYPNINELKDLCIDMPVIIVSAGPSLQKNISYLKDVLNKCLIISVGSSANILEYNGIIPHIILAVDGNITESHIFEKLETTKPILIYSTSVHYNVINSYKGPKLWMKLNVDNYLEFISNKLKIDTMSFHTGPSVANIALDFSCRLLNARQVIFIGQDLAYSTGRLYADGNVHYDSEHINLEESGNYVKMLDVYDNETYTSSNFIMMKNWFEDYISAYKKVSGVYNCTEGGLNIKGIPNMTLKESIDQFCIHDVGAYDRILEISTNKPKIDIHSYKKLIDDSQSQCEKSLKLSKKRLEICEDTIKHISDVNEFRNQIDEILKIEEDLRDIEIYNNLIIFTGERYINAIATSTNNKIAQIQDLNEQKKEIVKGLIRQYLYIHESLEIAKKSFNKIRQLV